MRLRRARLIQAVLFAVAFLVPVVASAQGVLPADAKPFLGGWTLGMESPQGAVTFDLTIKDQGGKVAGQITSQMAPEAQVITDVTKSGESLVLKYSLDFQGTPIPAKITTDARREKMNVSIDFADGQFTVDATATKK